MMWDGLNPLKGPDRDGFDRFGSVHKSLGCEHYALDLLPITFIPVVLPASLHFFKDEDGVGVHSSSFVTRIKKYRSLGEIVTYVNGGLTYVYGIWKSEGVVAFRGYRYERGTEEVDRALIRPKTMAEWLAPAIDLTTYPHRCPSCGLAAYVGFNTVECSSKTCRNSR